MPTREQPAPRPTRRQRKVGGRAHTQQPPVEQDYPGGEDPAGTSRWRWVFSTSASLDRTMTRRIKSPLLYGAHGKQNGATRDQRIGTGFTSPGRPAVRGASLKRFSLSATMDHFESFAPEEKRQFRA